VSGSPPHPFGDATPFGAEGQDSRAALLSALLVAGGDEGGDDDGPLTEVERETLLFEVRLTLSPLSCRSRQSVVAAEGAAHTTRQRA
jgi:hypothetical protein